MSFFEELKRRNVVRVGIAYVIAAWLLLQLTDVLVELLGLPDTAGKFVVLLLIIGFVPAVIFAWAFEMTPDGIKLEKDVDRSQSITGKTGRKLDFVIIGILVLGIGYLLVDKFLLEEGNMGSEPFSQDGTVQSTDVSSEKRALTPAGASLSDNSIAVLPFANRSNNDDDLFFTDGIHDDLLTQLAKISGLKVISRTSVMEYRDTTKKIPEIARELGVTKILEGGVQRAGKRIRINAQLIDVTNDQHLWAETFDREMTIENLFDIQTEITRQIVSAVKLELTEAEQSSLANVPTNNLQAYEAYLQARALLNRADYAKDKYIEAQPWAERAVQLDPEFAPAWAILTEIHGMAIWIGYDGSPERKKAARHARDMAIRYGPDLPSTLAAQADYLYRLDNDFDASLKVFKTAHQALPGDASILERMAIAQRRLGQWEESIDNLQKVVRLDPANSSAPSLMVSTLMVMQQWQKAVPLIEKWTLKFPEAGDLQAEKANARTYQFGDLTGARILLNNMLPRASEAYANLAVTLPRLERDYQLAISIWEQPVVKSMVSNRGWLGYREVSLGLAYQALGDTENARQQWLNAVTVITNAGLTGTNSDTYELGSMATAYALLDEPEKALAIAKKLMAFMPEEKDRIDGTWAAQFNAFVLARTGHREQALSEIERLLDHPVGFVRWVLYLDPQWDFFRDDERFNELIRPLNLQEAKK